MTATNEPSDQPPQPVQPPVPQPAASQSPKPQSSTPPPPMQQFPGAPQNPQYPPQYPNAPQYGGVPYGNAQYGNAQYGNAQYGNAQYGNYGPYNNSGPYGYPMGYYPQPPGTNGMAIASLVLGICGFLCVTPFVGIGLGIAALSKINKTGQPGKGMAIAGIILSSVWIGLLILAIATGNFHFGVGTGTNPGPSVGQTQNPNGTSA